jgi:tetratricopeptide (TPR) repeat protein
MTKKLVTLTLLVLVALSATNCKKLQARDNLNKGIKAFRDTHYEKAVDYFKAATELDPELTNAELYLATAYAQQYIPGGGSDENKKFADNAIQTFEKVLQKDSKNTSAVAGLAGIYQSLNDFQKAREYYKKQQELEPTNATAFYSLGSIDWYICYDKNNPPPPEEQMVITTEGLASLDKAIAINPDYEEALTFKNLLLRVQAGLTKDEAEKKRLTAEADTYFAKALETRQKNIEKQQKSNAGGITLDSK